MAKKIIPESAYGTELTGVSVRSNHPVRSRYLAALLAIVFGLLGVNHFYLKNIGKGLLMILLTVICLVLDILFAPPFLLIAEAVAVLQGIVYLIQTDSVFMKKNHVRTV